MDQTELFNIIHRAAQTKQTCLTLSSKGLTELPRRLWQLRNLRVLDLDNNQLSILPLGLGQLTNLTELYIYGNELSLLPPELGQLAHLLRLDVSHNELRTLPPELDQLTSLTELLLAGNQLSVPPPELGHLTNLMELSLADNRISVLPPELGQLTNLRELNLAGNRISVLPPELGQLTNLTRLSLSNNQLSALPPELGQLTNLTRLSLSNSQLSVLPPELGQLTNLTVLNLDNNHLRALPPELGQLTNLTVLNLSHNQLRALPPELGQLTNLTVLNLSRNLLTFPAPEIIKQGTTAILEYLREQITGTQQWVSKLLVVGEGGVGKTSLLRALNGEAFDFQESTTRGIAVGSLSLSHPTMPDVTMQLKTWDFAGQEINHATHQFFLTNRSLFLLVWNARHGWEQGKLIYWLKTIRANAPDSPIILVATHIDEPNNADLPLSDLHQQFPQIIGQWEISSLQGTGIEALQQAITAAAAALPLMGERWPTTWLNFANALRNSKQQYAPPQKFWDIMTKYKVTATSQPILATWLHELGDILFFQDNNELNDIVIFKPQWVTEHISRVLEATEVIHRDGIFTRVCMDQIWRDLHSPMRQHFLRLMERFDLSYRTLEDKDISLVVERLPFEPPTYESIWNAKPQELNCKQITMKFQLSEILPGIPTWFIARQHRFTIEQGERRGIHWRTGVLFQDTEQKHLALTKVGRDDRTNAEYLQLTVRGAMPHNFFDLLKEGIELTLRRYPGLQITRLIPCPDPNQESCLHEFDYANLVKRLERTPPKDSIECPSCLENISVSQLLFGLHWTTQDAVLQRIDELEDSIEESMRVGFEELRNLVQSNFLRQFRQQQKLIESHCPNVFVLRPDNRKVWSKDIGMQRINLQLYCQMPGCMHPTLDPDNPQKTCGLYPIDDPQQWLRAINPYYRRMMGVLKFATPLIGPWLGIMEAKDYEEMFKSDIDLAKELVSKLPDFRTNAIAAKSLRGDEHHPETLDGSPLRALRQLLEQKDSSQQWGNLKKILTPEGDYLWLCDHHARSFKP